MMVSAALLLPARHALSAPPSAASAEADAATKEAKALGRAGLALFDHGDYAGALENFRRAYKLYPAPTLGVFTARSLAKLGRLLEARELYARVVDTPLDPRGDATFRRAVDDARNEQAAIAPRIPSVVVTVRGATEPVRATVDDKPLTPGATVELDPGDHRFEATAGGHTARANAHLGEGERGAVTLDLTPPPAPPPVSSTPVEASRSPLKTVGFVTIGVGGIGLLAGGAMALVAVAEKSSLDKSCKTPLTCDASQQGKVDTYNTLRTTSAVALYAGAGVAAIGVVLVIAAPARATEPAPAAALRLVPGGVALEGVF